MASEAHKALCKIAVSWLRRVAKCRVVFQEAGLHERPDAFGWRAHGSESVLVECKVSLDDFAGEVRKQKYSALGRERYYLTPRGLIYREMLPRGWGLLEWDGKGVVVAQPAIPQDHDHKAEVEILYQRSRGPRRRHESGDIEKLNLLVSEASKVSSKPKSVVLVGKRIHPPRVSELVRDAIKMVAIENDKTMHETVAYLIETHPEVAPRLIQRKP